MDTSSSNHLTGKKKWLVDFDYVRKTKIRCDDDEYLNTEGMRNFSETEQGQNCTNQGCIGG